MRGKTGLSNGSKAKHPHALDASHSTWHSRSAHANGTGLLPTLLIANLHLPFTQHILDKTSEPSQLHPQIDIFMWDIRPIGHINPLLIHFDRSPKVKLKSTKSCANEVQQTLDAVFEHPIIMALVPKNNPMNFPYNPHINPLKDHESPHGPLFLRAKVGDPNCCRAWPGHHVALLWPCLGVQEIWNQDIYPLVI